MILIISVEQISTRNHVEEHRAQTKDIALVVITKASEYLRCYIGWGAAFVEQF